MSELVERHEALRSRFPTASAIRTASTSNRLGSNRSTGKVSSWLIDLAA